MPQFSAISRAKLEECHPELQRLITEVVKGFDCVVVCGHRSQAEQQRLYGMGRSKVRRGKHNESPSLAVDVAPWNPVKRIIPWDDTKTFYLFVGYVKGVASQLGIKIRCGADWDGDNDIHDQTFHDLPHFELVS